MIKKQKKIVSMIIALFLFFSLIPSKIFASGNPYYYHDCTWTAWQYAHDYLGIDLPAWGYARNWFSGAQGSGYPTGYTPAVYAVMVWQGHVGMITQVSGDGSSVYIVEGGWGDGEYDWYHEGWYRANGPSSSGKAFIGYVYLGDIGTGGGSSGGDVYEEEETPQETTPSESVQSEGSSSASTETPSDNASSAQVTPYDTSAEEKERQLAELKAKKAALEISIANKEQEIQALNEEVEKEKEEQNDRIRAMYMLGGSTYVELLFSSKDVKDLLQNLSNIGNIIQSDRKIIAGLDEKYNQLNAEKEELQNEREELEKIMI